MSIPRSRRSGAKHDRYYLRELQMEQVAYWIVDKLDQHNICPRRWEDPCAGNGLLSTFLPDLQAFDLNPEPNKFGVEVKQRDFFKHRQNYEPGLAYLMNVPYTFAVEFVNHGADHCDVIVATVPKTWSKKYNTFTRKINKHFHLIETLVLPRNSFYIPDDNNKVWDVPSVVQLWVRKDELRIDPMRKSKSSFFEVRQNRGKWLSRIPDVAIRRTGANAGQIFRDRFDDIAPEGGLYFYIQRGYRQAVLSAIESINWYGLGNGLGQRGINKSEVINAIEDVMSHC